MYTFTCNELATYTITVKPLDHDHSPTLQEVERWVDEEGECEEEKVWDEEDREYTVTIKRTPDHRTVLETTQAQAD